MNVILLSGGSGTRLWPLSNEVRSKQFLKIFRTEEGKHESMVQRMYRMLKEVDPESEITIATALSQYAPIKNQLGEDVSISIEPCRKDTFPAISLATAYLRDVKKIEEKETVVVCPVDPLVDSSYFTLLKKMSDEAEDDCLTLMGIKPTYPSEKYGYIISDKESGRTIFKEKPTASKAEEYIRSGALWNGGVFAFKINYILKKVKEICGFCDYRSLYDNYEKLEKISFDYAVAEHETKINVVKYSGDWKDLGTWNTFTEAMQESVGGNAVMGENCENVHIVNELSLPLVALGLKNTVIVASPDGILVSDKGASSYLRKYVPDNRPMVEKRIWGEYRIIDYQIKEEKPSYLTKELIILPGKSISYQKHFFRTEVWTCVMGKGKIIIDGTVSDIETGKVFCIAPNTLHSVKAETELHIIEVQFGKQLREDDIERFDFDWDNN